MTRLANSVNEKREAARAQFAADHPDIKAVIDSLIASAVQRGSTPEEAKAGIKVRWAYNHTTGAEVGTAPEGVKAYSIREIERGYTPMAQPIAARATTGKGAPRKKRR